MKKKTSLSFFDTNPFILFCVIFAVMIIVNVAIGILSNEAFYLGVGQLRDSAILCLAPIAALMLFKRVPFLKYFNDDDCSPWISVPTHYVISSAILLLATFAIARFEPAPAGAYISAIFSYTQGYAVVVVLAIVIEIRKMSNVNKNLKKIQDSLVKNKTNKGDTQ
jgi:hypothetical protein